MVTRSVPCRREILQKIPVPPLPTQVPSTHALRQYRIGARVGRDAARKPLL